MKRFSRATTRWVAAAVALGIVGAATGCSSALGGGGGDAKGADRVIKIGYVSPQTGPLAAFGESDKYVIDTMRSYYDHNGITMGDGKHKVEIIVKDTQSDSKRAGDVTSELILQDHVDLILTASTADTVNPVQDIAEANGVPTISTVDPWQAYYFGRNAPKGGFKWGFHFFWGLDDVEKVFAEMWKAEAPDASSVGMLIPNDADGGAWADAKTGLPPFIDSIGKTSNNPGLYPTGTTDYTAQVAAYKAENNRILLGVPIPPDFITFWKQAVQQGYHPEVATIARAMLFPSTAEALGKLADNISTEVWWHPTYPFSSSLTGQSAQELADAYQKTTGKQWTQPLGFSHALFEVATAALEETASLDDPAAIAKSIGDVKVDTIVGTVDFTKGPVPGVATTPLVGGQWRLQDDGSYKLVVVVNGDHPEIPLGGKPDPIDWTGK